MLRYSQNCSFFISLFTAKPLMMTVIFIHGRNQNFLSLTGPLCKKKKILRGPYTAMHKFFFKFKGLF